MRLSVAVLLVVMIFALSTSLGAQPRTKPNISFFVGGNGNASWQAGESHGGEDNMAVALTVPGNSPPDYAGIFFNRAGGSAPVNEPSFWLKSSVISASGGSPRLVLFWSDGGSSQLRPLVWTGDWQQVGAGSAINDWDNNGGSCGFLYATTYATTVGCHTSAFVVSTFIVTDSGWLIQPYVHFIDDISLYGHTFASPKDNANN